MSKNRGIRIPDDEWQKINDRAEEAGMSVGLYVRKRATGEMSPTVLPAIRHELRQINFLLMQIRDSKINYEFDEGREVTEHDLDYIVEQLRVITTLLVAELEGFSKEDIPAEVRPLSGGPPLIESGSNE